jgi:hypothetical protein
MALTEPQVSVIMEKAAGQITEHAAAGEITERAAA